MGQIKEGAGGRKASVLLQLHRIVCLLQLLCVFMPIVILGCVVAVVKLDKRTRLPRACCRAEASLHPFCGHPELLQPAQTVTGAAAVTAAKTVIAWRCHNTGTCRKKQWQEYLLGRLHQARRLDSHTPCVCVGGMLALAWWWSLDHVGGGSGCWWTVIQSVSQAGSLGHNGHVVPAEVCVQRGCGLEPK